MQRFVPLIIVLALAGLFFMMMTQEGRNPNEIKSVMIGKPAPAFALPGLDAGAPGLTDADLRTGEPVLVNFFASWCVPCRAEHESLMALAREHGVSIIGIAYKDTPDRSLAFLDELGNPFAKTGADLDGRVAIDWGVTGVPETFLVDGSGTIVYRHWGPIVGDGLEAQVLPALEALK
ncbi:MULTISPECIES: DsbE family thiol:disulfide interchange protein [Kordiimonas]|jgi:cytochrome c biogenesis protein CcmG/thiol:disulfide interchange protein DsbE|uniref:DsbE family thiol:disulfide interchange protein n=1 Tax=Kordiimonas TaxID=288021 RepID=UPI00257BC272|nr:DsbE family thiol:disulfide interchange protein [Kordiimonas sp. UBA4487]